MFAVRPCQRPPRFALPAFCLALALAVPGPSATVSAQQPAPAPAPSSNRFDIRFLPREQRMPVSYELVRGMAVFKALVNDREVWALLDNQARRSVMDQAFARSLGFELGPVAGQVVTTTGTQELWRVPDVDIRILGQVSMRAPVPATDLSAVLAAGGRPISLILGKEYFSVLSVLFTPGDRRFELGPSGTLRVLADTPYLPLLNDHPQIELMIAGRPAVLTVDLGYNGGIALGQEAWDRLEMGALPAVPHETTTVTGVTTPGVATTLDEVSLGSRRVRDVKVALMPVFPEDGDGLIGFGLLSRFSFAIDIKARRIWLIPPFPAE